MNLNPNPQASVIDRFLSDQQDPVVAKQIYDRVTDILTRDEQIQYIAVQKPLLSMTPDAVVLTNRRLIIYRPKLLGGVSFEDYIWRDLYEMKLDEGMMTSTITAKTIKKTILALNNLPKAQARKLYSYGQEMEEQVREERRAREMEEKRAASGGVNIHGLLPFQAPTPAPMPQPEPQPVALPAPAPDEKEDPLAVLKKLKVMLTEELITQEEYDAKKLELLARM